MSAGRSRDSSPARLGVLLVDDDEDLLKSTAALLSEWFDVTTARDAIEALELMKTNSFDVVCSDYRMPGMSGVELLRQVDGTRTGRVLITSNRDFFEGEERCLPGEFKVVFKPCRIEKLSHALEFEANRCRMLDSANSLRQLRRGGPGGEEA